METEVRTVKETQSGPPDRTDAGEPPKGAHTPAMAKAVTISGDATNACVAGLPSLRAAKFLCCHEGHGRAAGWPGWEPALCCCLEEAPADNTAFPHPHRFMSHMEDKARPPHPFPTPTSRLAC